MTSRYPRRVIYTKLSAALFDGPLVVPLDWLQQLSLPVLRKSDHATQAASGGIDEFTQPAAPEVVTLDKWYAALSEPTRRMRRPQGQSLDDLTQPAAPEVVTLDKWFASLSEPTRRKTRPHGLFVDEFTEFALPPETVTLDKWYGPLSEPQFRKPFHQAPWLIGAFASTTPAIIELGWLQALSEPVRPTRIGYLSGETQILRDLAVVPDIDVSWSALTEQPHVSRWSLWRLQTAPEWGSSVEIAPDTWFQPLSEPVRRKHFDPSTQISAALSSVTPPSIQFVSEWLQPLSTPVRRTPYHQPAGESAPDVTAFAAPETITLDKWFQPAGEPIRVRRPVNKASGESAPTFTPAEEIFSDKWDAPVSQPLFAKRGRNPATGESAPIFVDPPPPPAPDYGWFVALVGPLPRLVSRHAALAAFYGDTNFPLPTVAAPDDDWTDTTPGGGTWTPVAPADDIWTDVPPSGGNWG